ncbi:hypothetical protein C8F01DRAFT_330409 [Mycena amicta]|nr:hypothetical protein C8F01DRAFT_330409 [Mycena amicta]
MPSATVSVSSLPLALEELLQRMNDQLVSATERKSRLYADLEAANTREPNEPAMDVLRSRLKLSEEVVAMKIKVVEDLDAKATPDELVETRRLLTLCESLAVERTDAAITSKKATKTGRQDRSLPKRIAEAAPKPTPSSASAPPTRTRAAASAAAAAESVTIDWDNYPLARPPLGTDWRDFFQREGLHEVAKAQARVRRGDPLFTKSPLNVSYGMVIVSRPPCERCLKHNVPCLAPDPAHSTVTPHTRCLLCREINTSCNRTHLGPVPHVYADPLAAYHNATSALGERPGLWMGPGVPQLDGVLPQEVWNRDLTDGGGGEGKKNKRVTRNSMGGVGV